MTCETTSGSESWEAKAKQLQMHCRLQTLCCPGVRLVGAQYFMGLDTSSLLSFVVLLKESPCCNITSMYREIVLNNGFCDSFFLKVYLSYLLLE